jgi:hypothetical protein
MNRLAIVGMDQPGFDQAPWEDPRYDCWTLNSAWRLFPEDLHWHPVRLRAWFELHSRRYLSQEWGRRHTHFKALAVLTVPVYVQRVKDWPELRYGRTFPRGSLRRAFPRGDYHASSLDWMFAYGIWLGYRDIRLYGVDFGPTDTGEPLSARACLEYWVGVAEGRGVRVTLQEPTGLFWIYNYGRERTPYHYDDRWRLVNDR